MPIIEVSPIDRETALNNIIASIALEEAGLAHIINAEGEKIQAIVGTGQVTISGVTATDILEINKSVGEVMASVASFEQSLKDKLELVLQSGTPQDSLIISGLPTQSTVGATYPLSVTGGSGTGAVSYHSDNPTVATVAANGEVTILAPGTATITVTKAGDGTYAPQAASVTTTAAVS
jgi:hypothetical protein